MTVLYRAGIGPIFQDYYLPIFTRFETAHRGGPSWNLVACLHTLNWMIFRRLWGAALAYAAFLVCAAGAIWRMDPRSWDLSDPSQALAGLGLLALYYLVPGLFGNWLLYAVMRKNVGRALAASSTFKEACTMLAAQASTRQRFVVLAVINVVLMCAALGAYLMFQDGGASEPTPSSNRLPPLVASPPVPALPASAPASAAQPASAAMPASAEVPASAFEPASAALLASAVLPASAPLALPASAPAASASPDRPAVDVSASKPRAAPVPVKRHASAEVAQAAASETASASTYYVNVGLFANDWNARYAQAKLMKAGVVSYRHALMTSNGKLTRIRAGPYESQVEADAAAQTIQALGLEAVVFRP
jgi:cell division septation protein DedD